MAYRLVRSLVSKRGVRIRNQRDGLGWGLDRKDKFSWGRSFSSRRAASTVVAASCCMEFWMAAFVVAMGRLGRVSAMGRAAGVGGGAR